jgi:hypothetical protein
MEAQQVIEEIVARRDAPKHAPNAGLLFVD